MLRSPKFYIVLLLCLALNIIPVVVFRFIKFNIFPSEEIELMKKDVEDQKIWFNFAFNAKEENQKL